MTFLAEIDRPAITSAHGRIRGHARETPVLRLPGGSLGVAAPLVLKLEHTQVSGSFKGRGALHSLLVADPRPELVVAASGGNHGIAVAYAAARLGVRAEIYVPEISAPAKVERLRALGAEVVVGGRDYAEALEASQGRVAATGAAVVHAFDQVPTVLGAGTLALELERQAPEVRTILVAVGGGGLMAGTAGWFRESRRLVAVEPEGAPSLHRARAAGAPVDVEVSGLAADALGARRIGGIAFELCEAFVDEAVLVTDAALREAQEVLWRELRLAVEPSAAAGLAALRSGVVAVPGDDPVALVLCGANLDPATLG